MASLIDAFNDAIGEDNAIIKFIIYALPVFICSYLYLANNKTACFLLAVPTFALLLTLMSNGICSIRSNKREILTFNPVVLISVFIKLFLAVVPILCIMTIIGYCIITFVKLPFDIPNLLLIFNCIVGLILFSVVFTAYLAFSKTLSIVAAYDLKNIFESAIDVLINLLFLIPQLIIANAIFIGVVWYLFFILNLPLSNPLFVYYCSFILIFNISVLSSYYAQISYELIKGKDSEYKDNYYIKSSGSYNNTRKK